MSAPQGPRASPRLHGWLHPAVLAVAGVSVTTGYAQFGVTAALADVARVFGEPLDGGASIAAQAGMSATVIGAGTAIIRAASLGALPISALADRLGRRTVLLGGACVGLALTALAAVSPSYWWFVAIFALGRPMLSATNALAGVVAAEETRASDRSKAIGLIAASYGIGAGLVTFLHDFLGFRALFGLAVVPLVLVLLLRSVIREPERFRSTREETAASGRPRPRLGTVPAGYRPRLALVATLGAGFTVLTGPANTFLFFYGEGVLGIPSSQMTYVVLALGPVGLAGLLLGRWAADRLGRRVTAAVMHLLGAAFFALSYSGTPAGLFLGYLLGATCQGGYGIAFGALSAEVFPTSIRATAAGWLTIATVAGAVVGLFGFGWLADTLGQSFLSGAVVLAGPMALLTVLFARLPETRGMELEESAPEN